MNGLAAVRDRDVEVGLDEALGKTVAKDLQEGVYTLPVILALRRVPALHILLTGPVAPEDVARAHLVTLESGALDEAATVARRHLDLARHQRALELLRDDQP